MDRKTLIYNLKYLPVRETIANKRAAAGTTAYYEPLRV